MLNHFEVANLSASFDGDRLKHKYPVTQWTKKELNKKVKAYNFKLEKNSVSKQFVRHNLGFSKSKLQSNITFYDKKVSKMLP